MWKEILYDPTVMTILLIMVGVALCMGSVLFGYILGRNSAGLPTRAIEKVVEPGDSREPEGDYFTDALPEYSDEEQRIRALEEE